jgi:hypothetical protein
MADVELLGDRGQLAGAGEGEENVQIVPVHGVRSRNVRSGPFNNLQLMLCFVECGTLAFSLPCSPEMI